MRVCRGGIGAGPNPTSVCAYSAQIPGSAAASAGGGTGTASGDATRINFPRSLRTLVPVSRTDEVALIEKEYRYGVFALAALAILVMIVVQVTMVVIGDRLEELHGVAEVPSWFARLATACGSLGFGVGATTSVTHAAPDATLDLVRSTKLSLTQSIDVEDWAEPGWRVVVLKACVVCEWRDPLVGGTDTVCVLRLWCMVRVTACKGTPKSWNTRRGGCGTLLLSCWLPRTTWWTVQGDRLSPSGSATLISASSVTT